MGSPIKQKKKQNINSTMYCNNIYTVYIQRSEQMKIIQWFFLRPCLQGGRVTLVLGLPSTYTFRLFLHDISTRKVGLPQHKGNLPECQGYPTCLENILLGITRLPRQGSIQDLSFGGEVPSGRRQRASQCGLGEYALRCNLVHFETQF